MEIIAVTASFLWAFKAGAPADAPPAPTDEVVYYATADKALYTLSPADGKKLWRKSFKAPLPSAPVVAGDVIFQFVPFPEGRVYALGARDGRKRWRAPAGPGLTGLAPCGEAVAVGKESDIVFYDAAAGRELRRVEMESRVAAVAPAAPGRVVAVTASGDVALCAAASAVPVWVTRVGVGAAYAAADADAVYVATAAGVVAALAPADGAEVWRRELGEAATAAPVPAGAALVVAGRRTVFALDAASGEVRWTFAPGGNVVGAAPWGEGAVAACEDGRVFYGSASGPAGEIATLAAFAAAAPAVRGDLLYLADGAKRLNCYQLRR